MCSYRLIFVIARNILFGDCFFIHSIIYLVIILFILFRYLVYRTIKIPQPSLLYRIGCPNCSLLRDRPHAFHISFPCLAQETP